MEGVTVLHEFTVGGPSDVGLIFAGVLAICAFSTAIWGLYSRLCRSNKTWHWYYIIACLVITLMSLGLIAWGTTFEAETRYKVILDEDVPYVAFTEQYEVVGQEGEIYTIRDRNAN
jgi:low affinity Fe/Cu permease